MDWARNRLGDLVLASDAGLFSYGLRCPTCGEEVFRRKAGASRRAHFSHFSFGAKPGCALYRPFLGTGASPSYAPSDQPILKSLGHRGCLFLSATGSRYQLNLRLPRLEAEAAVDGEIEIQSKQGTRFYSAIHLLHKQFVPLFPEVPPIQVSGSGQLAAVADSIREDVHQFNCRQNIFQSLEDGGKMLGALEPLELGRRYCVLTREKTPDTFADLGILITPINESRGWYVYEMELPVRSQTHSPSDLATIIGGHLSRLVRPAVTRIWPIDPPHHVELDGTLVYPKGVSRISVRRTGISNVRAIVDDYANDVPQLTWMDNERGEIHRLAGEFTLLSEDQEQFSVKIEECERFTPLGIQVQTIHGAWELFTSFSSDMLGDWKQSNLRIICPSERIARSLKVDSTEWIQSGESLTYRGQAPLTKVDAGGFGSLTYSEQAPAPDAPASKRNLKEIWLEGVTARIALPNFASTRPWGSASILHRKHEFATYETLAAFRAHMQLIKTGE